MHLRAMHHAGGGQGYKGLLSTPKLIHAYARTRLHTYAPTHQHLYIHAHMPTCVPTCLHACHYARLHVYMPIRLHVYTPTCILHTDVYAANVQAHGHVDMQTSLHVAV